MYTHVSFVLVLYVWHMPEYSKALCQAAGVDAECTSAAIAALEREAGFAYHTRVAGSSMGDSGVDFARFVTAVRAVLRFVGR